MEILRRYKMFDVFKMVCAFQNDLMVQQPKRQEGKDERPNDDSQLPQLPPEVLRKIASMFDDGDSVKSGCDRNQKMLLRQRRRLASVSRQMNAAVVGSIDKMPRRKITVYVEADHVRINDIIIEDKPKFGYTQMELIDALLAFGRPNYLKCIGGTPYDDAVADHQGETELYWRDGQVIVERILASVQQSYIVELYLELCFEGPEEGALFCKMLTSIGKMVNLKGLRFSSFFPDDCSFATLHKASSPVLPSDSPFLELTKLSKLRALDLDIHDLLTSAQQADLVNRSSFNFTNICGYPFGQVALLSDRVRAGVTSACCLNASSEHSLEDLLQLIVECLPQCANTYSSRPCGRNLPNRQMLDRLGRRLVQSAVACGRSDKIAMYFGIEDYYFHRCVAACGQTVFTYEQGSSVVQLSLVLESDIGVGLDCSANL